jgi:hypothetical protein
MDKLALLIALVALGIAVLAYQEAGGTKDLAKKAEVLRHETADMLQKVERALRAAPAAKP